MQQATGNLICRKAVKDLSYITYIIPYIQTGDIRYKGRAVLISVSMRQSTASHAIQQTDEWVG